MLHPWGPVFPEKWCIILCLVFIYFAVLVKNWAHRNILPGADTLQQGSQLYYLAWLSQFTSVVPRAAVKEGKVLVKLWESSLGPNIPTWKQCHTRIGSWHCLLTGLEEDHSEKQDNQFPFSVTIWLSEEEIKSAFALTKNKDLNPFRQEPASPNSSACGRKMERPLFPQVVGSGVYGAEESL